MCVFPWYSEGTQGFSFTHKWKVWHDEVWWGDIVSWCWIICGHSAETNQCHHWLRTSDSHNNWYWYRAYYWLLRSFIILWFGNFSIVRGRIEYPLFWPRFWLFVITNQDIFLNFPPSPVLLSIPRFPLWMVMTSFNNWGQNWWELYLELQSRENWVFVES